MNIFWQNEHISEFRRREDEFRAQQAIEWKNSLEQQREDALVSNIKLMFRLLVYCRTASVKMDRRFTGLVALKFKNRSVLEDSHHLYLPACRSDPCKLRL